MRTLIKKIALVTGCVLVGFLAQAQQEPNYTQYMYNTMVVNPAYAGTSEMLNINGSYRSQWTGFDGAPETMNLGIESPISERVGLGINLMRDVLGPSDEYGVTANFAYTIPLNEKLKLSFGLSGGINVLNVDFAKGTFNQGDDPLLMDNINNQILGIIGAGTYVYSDNWYVGLSTPNFFSQKYYDDVEMAVNADELHLYLIGGYVFDLSPNAKFKPAFLLNYVEDTPLSAVLTANFLLFEKLTLGVGYELDANASGLAGFNLTRDLFLGYAYSYSTTDLNNYNNGTHEIILKFSIGSREGMSYSPRFF